MCMHTTSHNYIDSHEMTLFNVHEYYFTQLHWFTRNDTFRCAWILLHTITLIHTKWHFSMCMNTTSHNYIDSHEMTLFNVHEYYFTQFHWFTRNDTFQCAWILLHAIPLIHTKWHFSMCMNTTSHNSIDSHEMTLFDVHEYYFTQFHWFTRNDTFRCAWILLHTIPLIHTKWHFSMCMNTTSHNSIDSHEMTLFNVHEYYFTQFHWFTRNDTFQCAWILLHTIPLIHTKWHFSMCMNTTSHNSIDSHEITLFNVHEYYFTQFHWFTRNNTFQCAWILLHTIPLIHTKWHFSMCVNTTSHNSIDSHEMTLFDVHEYYFTKFHWFTRNDTFRCAWILLHTIPLIHTKWHFSMCMNTTSHNSIDSHEMTLFNVHEYYFTQFHWFTRNDTFQCAWILLHTIPLIHTKWHFSMCMNTTSHNSIDSHEMTLFDVHEYYFTQFHWFTRNNTFQCAWILLHAIPLIHTK